MRNVLRVGIPHSDHEVLHEFDRARVQTRMNIYHIVMRLESGYESEEDEPQPNKIQRSTRTRKCCYYNTEDVEDFEDEVFTPEKYKEMIRIGLIMYLPRLFTYVFIL